MLFNTKLFNTGLYNGGDELTESLSTDLIVFNGFSMSSSDIITEQFPESGPTREIIGGNVPRGHGQYRTADYFRAKTLEFSGIATAASAAALNTLLDTIMKALSPADGHLDITRDGVTRRFVATLRNPDTIFSGRQGSDISVCPFRCIFECREPFGHDVEYTAASESISIPSSNYAIQNIGTAPADPVFILIFDAATAVSAVNIQRIDGNGNTLQEIEFADTINAGDVLEFDSERKKVILNGIPQRFTGSFLELEPGANLVRIAIAGTSFSITATLKHKNAYLNA